MSFKEKLFYEIKIDLAVNYTIKARIGDGQPGDHNVFGTCPYDTEPMDDNPEWVSYLGTGDEIINKILYLSSVTQENNPHSKYVSVRIFINGEQVLPIKGRNELLVDDNEIVYFNQQINFI